MDIEKNINLFIEEQFSSHYRDEGALLVEFMECYYKWGQESGNFTDAARSLNTLYDVDEIAEEFLDFLHNEFLSILPKDLKTNKRTLIKNILGFYQSRGTEDAYRLLFRILYNQEINLYYPGKDILRASDGKWYVGQRIEISTSYSGIFTDIPEIIGATSGAVARIENSIEYIENTIKKTSLYLTNIKGTFIKDENVKIRYQDTIIGKIISNGVLTDRGYWLNSDGQLSSDKRLQDNFYYQDYSYEVQSSISLVEYRDIATQTVHPAGTKLFGKVVSDIIIDGSSYLDVIFASWPLASNDNSIEIDNSHLELSYDNTHRTEAIADRSIQEFAGTGLVSINDGLISDFSDFTVADFGNIPLSLLGSPKLIVGTGTLFTSEISQPNGPVPGQAPVVIKINDIDNAAVEQYNVDISYSNRLLTIDSDYYYQTLTSESFNIIRSINSESFGYGQYVSVIGSGTITWNNTSQLFDGTGTNFNMEMYFEDIIEIISTGERFLVTGVGNDVIASVLTDSAMTATIVNEPYKIYKNLTNPSGGNDDNFVTHNAVFLTDGLDYLTYV